MIKETYIFREGNSDPALHVVQLEQKMLLVMNDSEEFSPWARLSWHQCPDCPLDDDCAWCPAAVSIATCIRDSASWKSTETVRTVYLTEDTQITRTSSAADALSSILLNQIVHSTCPLMKFDFWFWQFFSPSLTIKNVLFRRLAIDLVCRDFSEKRNVCLGHASISTQKLASILECLTKRILSKGIVQADAAPNALAKLASLATYANYFQDEIYDHIQQGFNDQ